MSLNITEKNCNNHFRIPYPENGVELEKMLSTVVPSPRFVEEESEVRGRRFSSSNGASALAWLSTRKTTASGVRLNI
ncbi:MAG: hypothetical protein NTX88_02800 [Candidatus Atribacteria bacterium]|nr:hypothetical protein [Candidatus Atribacteria bacterium]